MLNVEVKETDVYVLDKYLTTNITMLIDQQDVLVKNIFSITEKMMLAFYGIKYSNLRGWYKTEDYINDEEITKIGKERTNYYNILKNSWRDLQILIGFTNKLKDFNEFANLKISLPDFERKIEDGWDTCLLNLSKHNIKIGKEECQKKIEIMYQMWSVNEKFPNLKSFL